MNIYAKLTILCLFLVLFTAGVLSFLADMKVKKTFEQEIIANTTQQATRIGADIGMFMYSRLNDIQMTTKNPYFIDINGDATEITNKLKELESLNDLYYSFSLFDTDRVRIGDSKNLSIGKKHTNSTYWKQLSYDSPSDVATDISKSESVGRAMIHFGSKIRDDANNYIGVLVGRIPVNELSKVVGEYTLGSEGKRKYDIYLVDENGIILYTNTDPSAVLESTYEDFPLVANLNEPGVHFVDSDDKFYFVTNETEYLSYLKSDWKLILTIPKNEALEPLSNIRRQILFAVLPVILISIVFALVAANFFVKPIVRLSHAAAELRKGNLNVELPISNDEIGKLAEQLSASSKSLARQLKEQRASNKKLQEQKSQIEIQKNQLEFVSTQIRDSISYAERIQRSTLPPTTTLQKIFPQSFVMYKPKDIIGGDFYWFERVRKGNNELMIIACGDCTGHGVPGAIMSIMGSNQLTNIVYYQNYTDPKKIISRLDKVIKFELQNDGEESNRDGMEIGICVIDLDTLKMEFAGAGIPLRIVKHNTKKLEIHKSPRQMVGGMEGDEQQVHSHLTKTFVQLDPHDRIFLSSDGFQDQFGGPDDKKFLSRNFNRLLEETSKHSILDQGDLIDNEFYEWSKNTSQTDDVCVLGFEVQ